SHHYNQSTFPGNLIIFYITHIVEIEHSYSQQTNRCGRKKHLPIQHICLQKIRTYYANNSKKNKYRNISKSTISIGFTTNGIGNGRHNCEQTERYKTD